MKRPKSIGVAKFKELEDLASPINPVPKKFGRYLDRKSNPIMINQHLDSDSSEDLDD